MARPRSFDEDKVVEAAMMCFWRNGYEATTTRMLEKATGVGIRGLANAFGGKDKLFETALDTYFGMVKANVDAIFLKPGLDAITLLFEGFLTDEPPDSIRHSGCLMVNTVFELEKTTDTVREKVEAYRTLWADAFRASLAADGIDQVEARTDFLVGIMWGALSQIKLTGSDQTGHPIAKIAIETVAQWKATP